MQFIKLVLLLKITISFCLNLKVGHYTQLWNRNSKIADDWVRPIANQEFKGFSETTTDYGSYDFIIVGAGSTGATLATRLAENPKFKLLLLEAGEDESDFSRIPGAINAVLCSGRNWGYLTTPQKYSCLGNINQQCNAVRGKALGGSSSINAMMYVRGGAVDFDGWEKLGNIGWSFKDVLPYFLKLENATGLEDADKSVRGLKGPLTVSYPIPKPEIGIPTLKATNQIDYRTLDYNGRNQTVANYVQMSTRHGVRESTNQAYLKRIGSKLPNLHIMINTLVTKLLLNNDVVTGVQFLRNGRRGKATAIKEVIVSGGAINSPQLLMLSGIGPKLHLQELGIPVVKNLPVGQNLDDHPTAIFVQISTNITVNNQNFTEMIQDYVNGRGILTTALGHCVIYPKNVYPNLEIGISLPTLPSRKNWSDKQSNYDTNIMDDYFSQVRPNTIITVFALLHPKSKGDVTLKSRDPTEFPKINPNFLDNPEDLSMLYEGIKFWRKLLQTDAMKKVNAKFVKTKFPPCENILDDRKYWYCIFRRIISGVNHPVSTCKMGKHPATSVVNNELLVHGFKNLRVADASVMPTGVTGHPNAACIMIGEKVADLIKKTS